MLEDFTCHLSSATRQSSALTVRQLNIVATMASALMQPGSAMDAKNVALTMDPMKWHATLRPIKDVPRLFTNVEMMTS